METELIVKWKIQESETLRILALLPELVEETRKEPGNLSYHIYQSADNPNELILQERYVDQEAAGVHKSSLHYQHIVAAQIIPHLQTREVIPVNKLF